MHDALLSIGLAPIGDACAPGGIFDGVAGVCPPSPVPPVASGDEIQMAGVIVVLGILILLVIFQALRPLLPERRAPRRRPKERLSAQEQRGLPLPFLLAISPILLFAALVVSLGLGLQELAGVVVLLMAGFGLLAAVGLRYALGVHTATEIVRSPKDSERYYLFNRFVPSTDPFAGTVDVTKPPRKRRRTTRGGVKAKPKR